MENKNDDKQGKRYERKPNFDLRSKLSRDGRYWIFERVETWIVPAKYLAVISQNHVAQQAQVPNGTVDEKPKRKGKRDADSNG